MSGEAPFAYQKEEYDQDECYLMDRIRVCYATMAPASAEQATERMRRQLNLMQANRLAAGWDRPDFKFREVPTRYEREEIV